MHALCTFVASLAVSAGSFATASDALVASFTNNINYSDTSGFEQTHINIFAAVAPAGLSDPFGGNHLFFVRTVSPSDAGTVYTADLSAPGLAEQAARLADGVNDDLWAGGDSDGGGDYSTRRENTVFAGAVGPDGATIAGPDLAGYTPSKVEMELDSLTLNWDGFFETSVGASITVRFYAEAPGPCNAADIAEPFGVLDLGDIGAFTNAFVAQEPDADLAPPTGVYDLADIQAFITAFLNGCP